MSDEGASAELDGGAAAAEIGELVVWDDEPVGVEVDARVSRIRVLLRMLDTCVRDEEAPALKVNCSADRGLYSGRNA